MSPKSIMTLLSFFILVPQAVPTQKVYALKVKRFLKWRNPGGGGGSVKGIIISFYVWLNSFAYYTRIIAETGVLSEMNK